MSNNDEFEYQEVVSDMQRGPASTTASAWPGSSSCTRSKPPSRTGSEGWPSLQEPWSGRRAVECRESLFPRNQEECFRPTVARRLWESLWRRSARGRRSRVGRGWRRGRGSTCGPRTSSTARRIRQGWLEPLGMLDMHLWNSTSVNYWTKWF